MEDSGLVSLASVVVTLGINGQPEYGLHEMNPEYYHGVHCVGR